MSKRIYICHTYYHAYVACLKESRLMKQEGYERADLMLSTMSNDFGNLSDRAQNSRFFEHAFRYEEKNAETFEQLVPYHTDYGNIAKNMISRFHYTKLLGKLEEPYIPVDLKEYEDIYVFCDSDPVGYYLNYKKIPYHALEDGLDCIRYYDTARFDNRGHFKLKCFLSACNLIFIQNGFAKYCLDMEVNDISVLPYPCKKYIEQNREELVRELTEQDKSAILHIFMEDIDELENQMHKAGPDQKKIMILTEPLCDLVTREKIFRDIILEYGKGKTCILKPHPRDLLDYESKFKDTIVIKGKFPMEVLNFIKDIEVEQLITVFTVPASIHFAKETIFLGEDFMDRYEEPELHRQNEQI